MTAATALDGGGESKRRDQSPSAGQADITSLVTRSSGQVIEGGHHDFEEQPRQIIVRETHRQLCDDRGGGEALEVLRNRDAGPREIKPGKLLQLTPGSEAELRHTTGEQVEPGPKSSLRCARATRDHRHEAGVARGKAQYAGVLQIVERMEHDRVG